MAIKTMADPPIAWRRLNNFKFPDGSGKHNWQLAFQLWPSGGLIDENPATHCHAGFCLVFGPVVGTSPVR